MAQTRATGVVLAGGGLAAVNAARTLRAAGYPGAITLVSDEQHEPYNRPPLSKQYLAGDVSCDELRLFRPGELVELGVSLRTGCAAAAVDTERRLLLTDDGGALSYDALVVATGAAARRLPVDAGLHNVFYLRSRMDAEATAAALRESRRVVVIGAGFIGLEVAATARAAGTTVTVLEAAPAALTRVLGSDTGDIVTSLHRDRGVVFHFGAEVLELQGDGRVEAVRYLAGGHTHDLSADLVVVGVGAVPRTEWLEGSGVQVDNGVVCDDGGRTTVPGVYAAGDVSRWRNALTGSQDRVEQWQAAMEQGVIVGANIAADLGIPEAEPRSWASVPYFWSDQYDHKLQFCGSPGVATVGRWTSRGRVTCFGDGEYGRLTGVFALDAPAVLARGRRLVAQGVTWAEAQRWLETL